MFVSLQMGNCWRQLEMVNGKSIFALQKCFIFFTFFPGGLVILWKQSDGPIQFNKALGDDSDSEDADRKEYWSAASQFRAMDGEDVYDLAWSPCSRYIAFGLTDNTTQVWEVATSRMIRCLKDHQHFVQGVAWDPLDQLLVTQSSDRSVKIWTIRQRQPPQFVSVAKVAKSEGILIWNWKRNDRQAE